MSKLVSIEDAVAHVKDGMTLMIGGFLGAGTGVKMVEAIANKGVKDLTLICNDTAYPNKFIGMLIANKQVKKLYASHIGTNADTIQQFNDKTLETSTPTSPSSAPASATRWATPSTKARPRTSTP